MTTTSNRSTKRRSKERPEQARAARPHRHEGPVVFRWWVRDPRTGKIIRGRRPIPIPVSWLEQKQAQEAAQQLSLPLETSSGAAAPDAKPQSSAPTEAPKRSRRRTPRRTPRR